MYCVACRPPPLGGVRLPSCRTVCRPLPRRWPATLCGTRRAGPFRRKWRRCARRPCEPSLVLRLIFRTSYEHFPGNGCARESTAQSAVASVRFRWPADAATRGGARPSSFSILLHGPLPFPVAGPAAAPAEALPAIPSPMTYWGYNGAACDETIFARMSISGKPAPRAGLRMVSETVAARLTHLLCVA